MTKRLYSSFPSGSAAIGLVVLRILTAGALVEQSRRILGGLFVAPESNSGTLGEIAAISALLAGVLIVIGLWTSVAASIALLLGVGAATFGIEPLRSLFFAWLSFAVALIGPGAWSLDARLFGWRQIRFPHGKAHSAER
jgi:uncharacterized membrane protein YphA (DoxX/SURF4 family)